MGILRQVGWVPEDDSGFVGIDTLGEPIGMISYGNDDLYNGGYYNTSGWTIFSDTWIWASGEVVIPEPSSIIVWSLLAGIGIIFSWLRRRR